MNITKILSIIFLCIIVSCSGSQESAESSDQNSEEPEIYVFDDISENPDTSESYDNFQSEEDPIEPEITGVHYLVQLGAFSSRERAEQFVSRNQPLVNWTMSITFSDRVNLFVVQLPPVFDRTEAERIRDEVRKTDTFKDAFIVTVR